MEKLIVPDVFVDVELIQTLTKNYHPVTKTRMASGDPLLVVTRSTIIDCFMLKRQAITKIDFLKFEQDYNRLWKTYRRDELPFYRCNGANVNWWVKHV